jgi:hypothetical protein
MAWRNGIAGARPSSLIVENLHKETAGAVSPSRHPKMRVTQRNSASNTARKRATEREKIYEGIGHQFFIFCT